MGHNPLLGVRVKIDRAKKHFNELNDEMGAFHDREPYFVVHYCDMQTRDEIYQLEIIEDIPARWGGAIGDIVHNLRSALDLLANDLVIHDGGMQDDWTKFPISGSAKNLTNDIASMLKGISANTLKLIHRLKPYQGGNDTLWRLHRLDIIDKHRLLVPVGGTLPQINWTIAMKNPWEEGHLPAMTVPLIPDDRQFPLENGAILFKREATPGVTDENQYQLQFVFDIAFGEGQIFDGEPVGPALKQLINFIERLIDIFARRIFRTSW